MILPSACSACFRAVPQAFGDDGSCQRLRYSLTSEGAWECQVLGSGFAAADASGMPHDGLLEGGEAGSGAGGGGPYGGPAGAGMPIWAIRTPFVVVGSTHLDGDELGSGGSGRSGGSCSGSGSAGTSAGGSTSAVHVGGAASPLVTERPVGASSLEVYTFEVEVLLAAAALPAWRTEPPAAFIQQLRLLQGSLCGTESSTNGPSDGDGSGDGRGGRAAGGGGCPLEFRARPLGWDTGQRELLLREHLLPLPASSQPTSGVSAQFLPGPGSAGSETPSSAAEGADGAAGSSSCVSRSWSITLQVPIPKVAGHGPPAQPPSGRLVDLSLWYGNELLAACVVLLVPPPPPLSSQQQQQQQLPRPAMDATSTGASGSGPAAVGGAAVRAAGGSQGWVDELHQVLSQQLPQVAHHVVMDLGMLLSGALAGRQEPATPTPKGLAAEDREGQEDGAAAAAGRSAAAQGGMGGSRASYSGAGGRGVAAPPMPGSSRAAAAFLAGQRALVMLDAGCSLLAFALQVGSGC